MVAFKIALRFLTSRKSQTILIVLGLAIAISVQLFVGILISSLQVGLVDAVTGTAPHITIESGIDGARIENWTILADQIKDGSDAVTGVTGKALNATTISYGSDSAYVRVKGLELETAEPMYSISDSILEGGDMPTSSGGVLIGSVLNEDLNVPVNGDLDVVMWDGSLTTLTISGIYRTGNAFEDYQMIVNLDKCQEIFNMGNFVDAIEIQVVDVFVADAVAEDITILLNSDTLKITNWKDNSEDLLNALQSQSLSSYMIQGFVLISVVIAITSVLAISVLQKSKQIGILKAMGIKDRTASLIFLYQGLLLGIMGAIGGILIGLFLLYGFIFGTSSGEEEPLIKLIIDFRFIALSGTIAVVSSMVASILPAKNSSKLSPVEVIRNG